MHVNEDDCEIKRKVKENIILKSRYENYVKFIEEKERWLFLKVAVSILSEKDNYKESIEKIYIK